MTESKQAPNEEMVECKVCLKEVPVSEASSDEARDYVFYFCGDDCYEKWQKQEAREKK